MFEFIGMADNGRQDLCVNICKFVYIDTAAACFVLAEFGKRFFIIFYACANMN